MIFIFDKETQIALKEKDDFSGALYCIENDILFFLFSIDDFKLYDTNDLNIFIAKEKFEDNKNKFKRKRTYNQLRGDFFFLSLEEKKSINKLIGDNILINC